MNTTTDTTTAPLTLADRKVIAHAFHEAYMAGELDTALALRVLEGRTMPHPETGEVCIVYYARVEHSWVWLSLITICPETGGELMQGEHLLIGEGE